MLNAAEILKRLDSMDRMANTIISENAAIRAMIEKPIVFKKQSFKEKGIEDLRRVMYSKSQSRKTA